MRSLSLLLAIFACLALQPTRAQEGGGGDSEVEVHEGGETPPPEGEEKKPNTSGLAGGEKKDEGDPSAPKVATSLQDRINAGIARGVEWLKKNQGEDGSWGPCKFNSTYGTHEKGDYTNHITGPTSFSLYTLAKCGVPMKDPVIQKGLAWMRKSAMVTFDTTGNKSGANLTSYESASIIMMLEAIYHRSAKLTGSQKKRNFTTDNPLEPPRGSPFADPKNNRKDEQGLKDWKWMHQRILYLTRDQTISAGKSRTTINGQQNPQGGWRYGQRNGDQDLSATQFVLLALRAASMAGYPVERTAPDTYKWALEFAKSVQGADGSFSYQKGNAWSASMDACGIGVLLIAREQMQLTNQAVPGWVEDSLKRGMAHLDSVFDAGVNQGFHDGSPYNYYYLYAVERIGDMTGRKEFNSKDWYVRGAELLLANQDPEGAFADSTCCGPRDTLGTCFALLFLKRATPPTVTISAD